MASAGDDLYLHFLQELKDKNIINNTIIIFFSDHGERFGPVRSTYNGMIESRTPYVFLVFPPWFHRKYADLMKVLKINQERLTSNADLYETLRDFLNFQASTGLGKTNKRGISLFQEIPRERTCEDAGIPIEYCLCNSLSHENISANMVLVLGAAVQDKISQNYVYHIAHKCEELFLHSVESVMRVDTGKRDENGTTELYQIKITTKPGGAIYEATVKFFNSTKKIEVIDDITRLNMYRGQADCIDDPRLRPFCFCRK